MMISHPPKRTNRRGFIVLSLSVALVLLSNTRLINDTVGSEEHRLSLAASSRLGNNLVEEQSNPIVKPHDASWCPKAVCHNSALCEPCKRRFLIIIATGRSASTTLMYMMDSLPGVRMSGENNNALRAIRTMIRTVANGVHFRRHKANPMKGAWAHNPIPDGSFACVAQHMIETINPPLLTDDLKLIQDDSDTIVGFKTIRFLNELPRNAEKTLVDYVKEHFPCARILVNIRSDIDSQASSFASKPKFSKERIGRATLETLNDRMRRVASLFGSQAILLDSSDWTKNIDSLNQVVQWLGFHESCKFKSLLEFNTEDGGYGHGRTEVEIDPNCRYVGGDETGALS